MGRKAVAHSMQGQVIVTVASWLCVAMPDCTLEIMRMLFASLLMDQLLIGSRPWQQAGSFGWLNC